MGSVIITFLVLNACAWADGGRPPLEPDAAFEGIWELASVRRAGKPVFGAPRRVVVREGKWVEAVERSEVPWAVKRVAGRPWPGFERTEMRSNGLSVMLDGVRGAYRLDGDTLLMSFAAAPDVPVPEDAFEPTSGRTIETWKRVKIPTAPDPLGRLGYGLGPDPAPRPLEPDAAFEGSWTLVEVRRRGIPADMPDDRVVVTKGRWLGKLDGQEAPWVVERAEGRPWPKIVRTRRYAVAGGGGAFERAEGEYRLDGDTLMLYFGPRPFKTGVDEIDTATRLEIWKRARRPAAP